MSFITPLQIEHIKGTKKYKLLSDIVYEAWSGITYNIPAEYSSDGHSIPKLLRSFAGSPYATKYPMSAWLHDWLLEIGILSRKEADIEYAHAMKDEGATKFQIKRNYLGIRLGSIFRRRR